MKRFHVKTIVSLVILYSIAWILLSVHRTSFPKRNLISEYRDVGLIPELRIQNNISVFSKFNGTRQVEGNFLPSFSTGSDHVVSLGMIEFYNEFEYKIFSISEPLFSRPQDRKLFYDFQTGLDLMVNPPYEKLRGVVEIIKNGYYPPKYLCGWPSNYEIMHSKSNGSNHFVMLCPILTPEGNSFQHFIDGLLPKLIQVRDILLHPDMQLLIPHPRKSDRNIILSIIERIGINESQIVWSNGGSYSADYMVATCITPPIHPILWNTARKLIGVQEELPSSLEETVVVLLTRAHSHNGGRRLLNKEEVTEYLNQRYGEKRVVVFKGGYSLNETLDLFGKTYLMIGVHGGALYNLNFAPRTTRILEIMPYSNYRYIKGLATTIFWTMANLIGQQYWRVFVETKGAKNNVFLDIRILNETLNKIDNFSASRSMGKV